jgi:hypothetical protein
MNIIRKISLVNQLLNTQSDRASKIPRQEVFGERTQELSGTST